MDVHWVFIQKTTDITSWNRVNRINGKVARERTLTEASEATGRDDSHLKNDDLLLQLSRAQANGMLRKWRPCSGQWRERPETKQRSLNRKIVCYARTEDERWCRNFKNKSREYAWASPQRMVSGPVQHLSTHPAELVAFSALAPPDGAVGRLER